MSLVDVAVYKADGLAINRSRVRIPAAPLSCANLGKLLTHMCHCAHNKLAISLPSLGQEMQFFCTSPVFNIPRRGCYWRKSITPLRQIGPLKCRKSLVCTTVRQGNKQADVSARTTCLFLLTFITHCIRWSCNLVTLRHLNHRRMYVCMLTSVKMKNNTYM